HVARGVPILDISHKRLIYNNLCGTYLYTTRYEYLHKYEFSFRICGPLPRFLESERLRAAARRVNSNCDMLSLGQS
ncbi:MAG TPA: hypothetical protein VFO40_02440, partial [Chthoniobacterales bacterium]|nr:hypothetical protein [Chthoniobacterales bacterium]